MTVWIVFLTTQESSDVLSVHSTEAAAEQRATWLNTFASRGWHQWEEWEVDAVRPEDQPLRIRWP